MSYLKLMHFGQPWEDWQREDMGCRLFADWEITSAVAKAFVSILHVKGNGIMHSRADTTRTEVLLELFPILDPDDIKVKNSFGPWRLIGKSNCLGCRA